jgi:hypothetical protein
MIPDSGVPGNAIDAFSRRFGRNTASARAAGARRREILLNLGKFRNSRVIRSRYAFGADDDGPVPITRPAARFCTIHTVKKIIGVRGK